MIRLISIVFESLIASVIMVVIVGVIYAAVLKLCGPVYFIGLMDDRYPVYSSILDALILLVESLFVGIIGRLFGYWAILPAAFFVVFPWLLVAFLGDLGLEAGTSR